MDQIINHFDRYRKFKSSAPFSFHHLCLHGQILTCGIEKVYKLPKRVMEKFTSPGSNI